MKPLSAVVALIALASSSFASEIQKDIPYASPDKKPLLLDLRIPDGEGPFPAVVIVHGGGWAAGDKASKTEVKPILDVLTDGKIAWFSVDYRLSREAKYPACIEDVEAAVQFVKAHAKEYRIDPNKVALSGDSAGGHIVDMVAVRATPDHPERKLAAVVSFYGPDDLVEDSFRRNANSPSLQALFGIPAKPLDDASIKILQAASPIAFVSPNLPPFLLLHGTADQSVDYPGSVIWKEALDALGVPCELITIPKGVHVMANWDEMHPPQTAYKEQMVDWLHNVFSEGPAPVPYSPGPVSADRLTGLWKNAKHPDSPGTRLTDGGSGDSLADPKSSLTWAYDRSTGLVHIQYPPGQGRIVPYAGSPDLSATAAGRIANAGQRPKVDFADWRYFPAQDIMISSNGEIFRRAGELAVAAVPTSGPYNVKAFGAVGDGAATDTKAFQKALDTCAVNGGGEVVVPAGTYVIGSIQIGQRTTLRLEKDSLLKGISDLSAYPICDVRWEGRWQPGRRGLIYAANVDHIAVVGPGQIEGTPTGTNTPDGTRNPVVLEPISCTDVLWDGFSVKQGGNWATHPTYCTDVVIKNVTIRGNRDGIDVDSCKNVRIEGCDIATGDDSISLKSGRGMDGARLGKACENVTITNCTLSDRTFACLGIGSETSGGVRNILIEHCTLSSPRSAAIYIKTRIGRAGGNETISGNELDVDAQMFLRINLTKGGNNSTSDDPVEGLVGYPYAKNIAFSNVRVKCTTLVQGTEISARKPLQNLTLRKITGTAVNGITLANTQGAAIEDIEVKGVNGSLLGIYNVTGTGLEGATAIPAPIDPPPGNATGRGKGPRRGPTAGSAPTNPPSPPGPLAPKT